MTTRKTGTWVVVSAFWVSTMLLLVGTGALMGCVYSSKETEKVVPSPATVVVAQPVQQVYTYPEGQYVLHGDGTASSPYYWVWIPTGAKSVPPPPLPPSPR